jgi:hypothetical protein
MAFKSTWGLKKLAYQPPFDLTAIVPSQTDPTTFLSAPGSSNFFKSPCLLTLQQA